MNTWPPVRQNLRLSSLNQYETYQREQGELETDPHPTCVTCLRLRIGALLLSLLCWGVVGGAVWGLWAVARWVLGA